LLSNTALDELSGNGHWFCMAAPLDTCVEYVDKEDCRARTLHEILGKNAYILMIGLVVMTD
jgi:hypothetical protein